MIHHHGVMAIPKAATIAHVEENAAALQLTLTAEDITRLERAFPAPETKIALDVV